MAADAIVIRDLMVIDRVWMVVRFVFVSKILLHATLRPHSMPLCGVIQTWLSQQSHHHYQFTIMIQKKVFISSKLVPFRLL